MEQIKRIRHESPSSEPAHRHGEVNNRSGRSQHGLAASVWLILKKLKYAWGVGAAVAVVVWGLSENLIANRYSGLTSSTGKYCACSGLARQP